MCVAGCAFSDGARAGVGCSPPAVRMLFARPRCVVSTEGWSRKGGHWPPPDGSLVALGRGTSLGEGWAWRPGPRVGHHEPMGSWLGPSVVGVGQAPHVSGCGCCCLLFNAALVTARAELKQAKGSDWLPADEFRRLKAAKGGGGKVGNPKGGRPVFKGGAAGKGQKALANFTQLPTKEKDKLFQFDPKGRCRFWNSSGGCQRTNCQFKHECIECGAKDHKWFGTHFMG